MFPKKYIARKGKLLPIESKPGQFSVFAVFSALKDEKTDAAADRCASFASIVVHKMIKQAGSFIPLHL